MQFPYPERDADPWFDGFESMLLSMDASGYAAREDRNIILGGGGSVNFVASTGVVSWSADLVLLSPISAFRLSLPASQVTLADGQRMYVNMTRTASSNIILAMTVGNQIPNTNDAMLIAIRHGNALYFRNGARVLDGETKDIFAASGVAASQIEIVKLATRASHNSETALVVGGDAFNPADYDRAGVTRTLAFKAVAANGDIGMITEVQLYNVTNGVLVNTLTFSSTDLAKDQVFLTEGPGTGEIDLVEKIYDARIRLTSPPGGPSETIELYSAEIVITSTAV